MSQSDGYCHIDDWYTTVFPKGRIKYHYDRLDDHNNSTILFLLKHCVFVNGLYSNDHLMDISECSLLYGEKKLMRAFASHSMRGNVRIRIACVEMLAWPKCFRFWNESLYISITSYIVCPLWSHWQVNIGFRQWLVTSRINYKLTFSKLIVLCTQNYA